MLSKESFAELNVGNVIRNAGKPVFLVTACNKRGGKQLHRLQSDGRVDDRPIPGMVCLGRGNELSVQLGGCGRHPRLEAVQLRNQSGFGDVPCPRKSGDVVRVNTA